MKKIKNLTLGIMTIPMMVGLTACPPDHRDTYVEVTAVTSCSPDLLQFVTPTVTITGDNGETQSWTLSAQDFKETTEGGSITINITVNGQTSTSESTTVNNVAERSIRFEDVESMKGDIVVTYKMNPDVSIDKDSYVFFNGVDYKSTVSPKDGPAISDNSVMKPTAYEVKKADVEEYLNKLVAEGDKKAFSVGNP